MFCAHISKTTFLGHVPNITNYCEEEYILSDFSLIGSKVDDRLSQTTHECP
jgi:hypothetical protein